MKQDIYKNNIPFFFFLFVTTKLLFSSLTFYSLFLLFILYSNFLFPIPPFYSLFQLFILYSNFLFSIPTFYSLFRLFYSLLFQKQNPIQFF